MISRLSLVFAIFPFFGTICAQSGVAKTDSTHILSKAYYTNSKECKIKWVRQLPPPVRLALHKSPFASWYVEKIIRKDTGGKTVYRLYVNNGNLLNGDHYYSFLKTDSLDIVDNGVVLRN